MVTTPEGPAPALGDHAFESVLSWLSAARSDLGSLSCLQGGGIVEAFEAAFAEAVGAPLGLAVSSGTAALHVALLASDIGPGDEVIVSPYGWGQTVAAVLAVGATPVFADIARDSGNLDPVSVDHRIGPRTAAVLVTHIHGHPADMARLGILCATASRSLPMPPRRWARRWGASLSARGRM